MKNPFIKKKLITLLSVNVISFLLILIFLEIILRLFFPEFTPARQERGEFWQYDKKLGWSQIPNTSTNFNHPEFSVPVTINEKGLRDNNYAYISDNKRILILGDSFAWGFGGEENKRFSELLDSTLNNWEVINAAVSGYSTIQQFIYLREEGLKYNPNIVLLLFYENDYLENTLPTVYWNNKPYAKLVNDSLSIAYYPVPVQSLYQKFRAYLKANYSLITFFFSAYSSLFDDSSKYDIQRNEEQYKVTELLINKMQYLCEGNGITFILVSIPLNKPDELRMEHFANLNKTFHISLSNAFRNKENYSIPNDGHWNAYGHSIAADSIYNYLIETRLVESEDKL